MEEILKKIVDDTKIALKESIIIDNKIIEDKLLLVLANTKMIEEKILKDNFSKKKKIVSKSELEVQEIEKVKRKIPLWLEKKGQYNYKILKAFMDLSNNGNHSVNINSLERYTELNDSKKFLAHYNQLKTISAKNHAKVFEENNQQISLWEPVEEFIISQFKNIKFYY